MALIKHNIPLVVICLWIGIIFLSINIDTFYFSENSILTVGQSDILFKIFGQLRHDIAAILYLKADSYYHGGTTHQHGDEHTVYDEMQGEEHQAREESGHRSFDHPKDTDFFSKVNRAIMDQPLSHLQGAKSAEIMPWFKIAVLIDPNFVPAYVMGGFWLSQYLYKPEKALQFLRKGLSNNPDSWQIYAQIGDIYFLSKKDYQKASAYYKKAYLLMQIHSVTNSDRKKILLFIAAAYERVEDFRKSLYYYEKLSSLFPDDLQIQKRVIQLKKKFQNDLAN